VNGCGGEGVKQPTDATLSSSDSHPVILSGAKNPFDLLQAAFLPMGEAAGFSVAIGMLRFPQHDGLGQETLKNECYIQTDKDFS
jgi:hypothetical protein